MLPALLLALAGLASPGTAPDAQLEVLEGRVSLAAVDGVFEIRSRQEPRMIRGAAYVEVPPLSRVSLRWHQAGSLLIEGPAAFEWSPSRDRIIWNFRQVGRTHLEIRSQRVRVYLPGGWIAAFENGASFLRERSGGSVEFHHDAGLPVLLSGPAKSGSARPPWTILAGAKLLLRQSGGRPAPLRGTGGRMLEPYGRPEAYARERHATGARWAGFSWPWRTQRDAPVAAHATLSDRGLDVELALELERLVQAQLGTGDSGDENGPGPPQVSVLALPPPPSLSAPADAEPGPDSAPDLTGATGALEHSGGGPSQAPTTGSPGSSGAELGLRNPAGDAAPADPVSPGTEGDPSGSAGELPGSGGTANAPPSSVPPTGPAPGADLNARIRRDGNLILTPYGVRWGDWVPTESTTPNP